MWSFAYNSMCIFCCLQEKNVKKDAIEGKVGNIYIPDQKVRIIVCLCFGHTLTVICRLASYYSTTCLACYPKKMKITCFMDVVAFIFLGVGDSIFSTLIFCWAASHHLKLTNSVWWGHGTPLFSYHRKLNFCTYHWST